MVRQSSPNLGKVILLLRLLMDVASTIVLLLQLVLSSISRPSVSLMPVLLSSLAP